MAAIRRETEALPPAPRRVTALRGVTGRAVLAGLLLTPLNILFLVKSMWVWGGFTGDESLFLNTVAVLFVLTLLNAAARARRSPLALSQGEILTVYLMLGVGTGLTCSIWDLGGSLAGAITYPFWFATEENGWRTLVWPRLPTWLTVRPTEVLEGFYTGGGQAYRWPIVSAWVGPALWWASFVTAVMWVCLCLNSVVRRRWADEEKLAFPLTIVPLELTSDRTSLLRNKLWWTAIALSAGVGIWNTLAGLRPALPAVPLGFDYSTYVQNRHPWDLIPYQAVTWNPWALGLCYLMPLDLAFSLFVFDVLWLSEYVVGGQLGWCLSAWTGFPYGQDQTAGGFVALVLVIVVLDRRYLGQVLRKALGLASSLRDDSEEAFTYRGAALGAVLGLCYLAWWLWRAGMSGWVVPVFLGMYYAMVLAVCRLRAQLGPPAHSVELAMPNWMLLNLAGSRGLGAGTVAVFALIKPFLLEQRNSPAPLQLEALKMAEGGRMRRRRIALALAVTAPLAILSYFWASLHVGYRQGMGTGQTAAVMLWVPRWFAEDLAEQLRSPFGYNASKSLAMGFGLVVMAVLMALKLNLPWWPLHPVAYPIALSASIQSMTPAIFGTWLVKAVLLRYGGLRAHRAALPFFLGLLVGHATVYTFQRILFMALGVRL
jgi:hypothetical protein